MIDRILKTENLIYRPISLADTPDILRWRNRTDVKKYFLYREDFTEEGQKKWLEEKVQPGLVEQFILIEKGQCDAQDRPIGSVYLQAIDYEKGSAEYGIFIGEPQARGLGLGTEAAKEMIRFAFEEMNLKRVYLKVLSDNEQAIHSYEKAGFAQIPGSAEERILDGEIRIVIFMEAVRE